MWDPNKVQMEPSESSMDTSSVAKDEECMTTNGHTVDAKRVSMDSANYDEMVVMDTGRHVDYVGQPVVENCRGVAPNGIVMDTVVMDTNRPVVETIKVSTTPVKQIIRATVTRQSSFVDNTHTLTRMNSADSHPHTMYNGDAFARRDSVENTPAAFARRESVENTTAAFARRESVGHTTAAFTRQRSIENTAAKVVAVLPVTTETTRHIAEQCVNTIKRSPRPNGKVERTPPPVHKKPAPLVGKKPVPPPTPPKSVAVLHAQTNEFPAPPSPHTLQAFQLDSTQSTEDVTDGAVSRNRFSNRTSTTPSRGSLKMPHVVPPAVPTKPCPMSPRPVSSPTPDSPQPNGGGLPWHRRTSSGPISPVVSVAKPKPPPPPKRGLHTKLSFHGDTAQSKNFMADLQRTLEQKQRPGGNKPPFPQVARTESIGDLPPPPPEVMAGLEEGAGKRKLPPPPPRRSNATHLTPYK